LGRRIVAQSNFVSAFQTHHVSTNSEWNAARISYAKPMSDTGRLHQNFRPHRPSRKMVDLLRCNYESAALK